MPLITYHLAVDEPAGRPVVTHEWLAWRRGSHGRPFRFLEYHEGFGQAASGETPDESATRVDIPLQSPDLLAVNALGQFQEHPRVAALRNFIIGWHVSYLSADSSRGQPEAGPQEQLNRTGDNLANVIQYLSERHPRRLDRIFEVLSQRVPRVERVLAEAMPDGRLLLQIKDAPFDNPVLARFASDGTLKMLVYLVLLYDPEPPPFIGVEEPENFLHPRLLPELAEECRKTCERTQLLVTTHSPFFLDALRSEGGARVLWRDEEGHTKDQSCRRLAGRAGLRGRRRATGPSMDGGAVRGRRSPRGARCTLARFRTDPSDDGAAIVEFSGRRAFNGGLSPSAALLASFTTSRPVVRRSRVFQGKSPTCCVKLENPPYAATPRWLPDDHCRIVVMVDRDNDECHALKAQLEEAAGRAGSALRARARPGIRGNWSTAS